MKLFENTKFYASLVPAKDFKLFCDSPRELTAASFDREDLDILYKEADEALNAEVPTLYATAYMRFKRDGNRSEYEGYYFARRHMLNVLTLAEKLEGKGRYLDKLVDVLWLICEETTWVLPAHNYRDAPDAPPLNLLTEDVTDEVRIIDLFSAETGSAVAFTCYLLKDELDALYPKIRERALWCLEKKILTPFEKYLFRWEGFTKNAFMNNWNPWIISNILTVTSLTVEEDYRRESLVTRAAFMLDRFVDSYSLDGGCDEGPSYWTAAGASLFDSLELLNDLVGGKLDVFENELIRNICDYFRKAFISGNYVMNFADAPAVFNPAGCARLLNRMARRTGNPEIAAFASYLVWKEGGKVIHHLSTNEIYRSIRDYLEVISPYTGGGCAETAAFPGISVLVAREKADFDQGLYFAMKGGTNGESHNHNDIGNVVIYCDGQPVIVDIGVGTYSRKTFSEERYTIKPMTSPYHNTAEIGGYAQPAGIQYASSDTVYAPDGKGMKIHLEKAYPVEAGVVSYTREGVLGQGKITLTDALTLDAEKEVIFNFISFEKPELKDGGISLGRCALTFTGELVPTVEEYVFEDVRFNRTWKRDSVWRIRLKGQTKQSVYQFVIA